MTPTDPIRKYREPSGPPPAKMGAWPLYGAGMENLGEDDHPVEWAVPGYDDDQLLVRVDACGMCFSDVKILRLGPDHPRLQGRDMRADPVVMGHEVSLTVVGVGKKLQDRYRPGDRFIVQADIWYDGVNLAYGYKIQGGLAQYGVLGREVLEGDDGCYLIPVRESTGYAQAALCEPWACVIAAYQLSYRTAPRPDGRMLVVGAPGDPEVRLSVGVDTDDRPRRITLVGYDGNADAEGSGADTVIETAPTGDDWTGAARAWSDGEGFDDIIASSSLPAAVLTSLGAALANGGIMCVVGPAAPAGEVAMDIGRVHYDGIVWIGADGFDIGPAYRRGVRGDLKPGGAAWFLGAGGPMGRMHVQRAIEKPDGPAVIVATDVSDVRLRDLAESYGPEAEAAGRRLICLNPVEMERSKVDEALRGATGNRGFDDVVVLAPVAALVADAVRFLGEGGVLNLFAGVARGTTAAIDVAPFADARRVRLIGSTASSIDDLRLMLDKTESGELSTNRSVAAVGGLAQAHEGIQALMDNVYPGKIVIYPQIPDLPITALPDMKEQMPEVHALLERGRVWTNQAEEELLRRALPPVDNSGDGETSS